MSRTPLAVIKLGGNLLEQPKSRGRIAEQMVRLKRQGWRIAVVHGGGGEISARLEQAGIAPKFVQGMRVTSAKAMDIVASVLAELNHTLVGAIQAADGQACGLHGGDGLLLTRPMRIGGEDLGRVGEVAQVQTDQILAPLLEEQIVVIAPTGADADSALPHNINADVAACALAQSLSADHLLLLSDVEGVLDAQKQLVSQLTRRQAEALIADGTINAGMVPKVRQALEAVGSGVGAVHILSGKRSNALYSQLQGDKRVGTRISA